MATKSLTFDIFGRDRTASKTIRGVGDEVDRASGRFSGFGAVAGVALAAVGAAAATFAVDSVKAYAEAEEAQMGLESTLERFPRLADTNIEKLQELNEALMNKTRFDDDAIATGQAVLGQFELTGQQLEELTPLMLDYAQKTGKDLPTAAEDLGKALLGQGRSLKDIGIDFEDTGTAAGNFDALVEGLRGQVGGFAEESAGTTLGKLDQLKNKFGEIQEAVGEELSDPLITVMDTLADSGALEGTATAVGDIATEFAELEEDTKFLSDFIEDMAGFGDFVDDVKRWGDTFANIGNPDVQAGLVEDQQERGGLAGGWLDFWEGWSELWGAKVPGATEDGMESARRGMGGGFSGMTGDMSVFEEATKGKWSGMWGAVDSDTRTGMGNVNSSASGGIGVIGGTLAGISPIAGGAFMAAWLAAQTATNSGWTGVDGSTRSGMGTVGGTLSGFRGVVEGPFAGASSWLISAGGNIVSGLVSGIGSMVGAAASAAATLAQNVVTGAKAALGIRSPSRVFDREVGRYIPAGLAQGILGNRGVVDDAIESLVNIPEVGMMVGATGTSAASVSASSAPKVYITGVAVTDQIRVEIEQNGRREKVALESGRRK